MKIPKIIFKHSSKCILSNTQITLLQDYLDLANEYKYRHVETSAFKYQICHHLHCSLIPQ